MNYKDEILQAEMDFCKMAFNQGVKEAFLAFAAEDGVINRNNRIFKGRAGIEKYFAELNTRILHLEWKPDYVDVSVAGDLGYTYGNYTLRVLDSENKEGIYTGVFHTVWKRQKDGQWKFVYD